MSLNSTRLAENIRDKLANRIGNIQKLTDEQKSIMLDYLTEFAKAIIEEITENGEVIMANHVHTGVTSGTGTSGTPVTGTTEKII